MFSAAMQEVENDGQCNPSVQLSPERLLKVKKTPEISPSLRGKHFLWVSEGEKNLFPHLPDNIISHLQ